MILPRCRGRNVMSPIWAASIFAVWFFIAFAIGQKSFQQQRSHSLVRYGALLGSDFTLRESWRLIASQWLHVNFGHMVFNAFIIAFVGVALEKWVRGGAIFTLGVTGGALAQLMSIYAYPSAYISGASQAYLVLCGMLLTIAPFCKGRQWWAYTVSIAGILVSIGLDLFASGHGAIKIGHLCGLIFGLIAGLFLRWYFHYKGNLHPRADSALNA
ncbi:rhomboid family intramembrane serine protease [Nocardia testacea]|uniref:rhomboid family intramembrane serine protease n=1 Tax=Nocardia testacea TaxID=248551 RepID=UPI000A0221AA|nr:rhomboid family intramembrane serine protease [Nocardia testacea]